MYYTLFYLFVIPNQYIAEKVNMSGLTLNCINSAENEFLAEETLVTIIPSMDQPQLQFLSGNFGPLVGGFPTAVPLWLAVTLRKRGKCTIQIPEWMTVAVLETVVAEERSQKSLAALPFHYIEIAQLILNHAREDVTSPDRIAVLLQDIENIRMDRIRLGVMSIADRIKNTDEGVLFAALNNVSAMEVFAMKRFFLGSMGAFYQLKPPQKATPATADMSSSRSNFLRPTDTTASGAAPSTGGRTLRKFRK